MMIWWSSYEDKPPSLLLSVRSRDKCGSVQPWTLHLRALCKSISLQRVSDQGFSALHNALWNFTHALLCANICSSGTSPTPGPPICIVHWPKSVQTMCCFIMHLVLNIARQFVERMILHRFAVRRCSTYYYTPLLPRTKPFLSKPSHMWRSSMQKRAVATNP